LTKTKKKVIPDEHIAENPITTTETTGKASINLKSGAFNAIGKYILSRKRNDIPVIARFPSAISIPLDSIKLIPAIVPAKENKTEILGENIDESIMVAATAFTNKDNSMKVYAFGIAYLEAMKFLV
jgi:hypothetical protein